jgi:hypothetical protein
VYVSIDQWDVQKTIVRIVTELQRRNYLVWLDRECYTVHTTLMMLLRQY